MNVVFCVDRNGLKQFAVAATSVAIHRQKKPATLFLLSVDVQESDVAEFFQKLRNDFGLTCRLIRIPRENFASFPVSGHVTVGSYFRLMIGEALPDDVSEVLYLDTDIVVHHPIDEALHQALDNLHSSGKIVAAVEENAATGDHLRRAGIHSGPYLNAGVMVINLPRWKEAFSLDYFVDILKNNEKNIIWWDQDILNIALQGQWLELSPDLNGLASRRTKDTMIYHYAGNQKPWHFGSTVDDKDIYEHYRQQTPVLRPPRIEPTSIIDYYMGPLRMAKKAFKKRLRRRFRKKKLR